MMKTYNDLPSDAGSNIIGQVTAQANRLQQRLASVKHTVAIMSGKGGVGKSALTANLAAALALKGNTVGVVDADINGPTLAKMMGVRNVTLEYASTGVKPAVTALGTKLISMDLLLAEDDAPVLWNAHSQKDAFTWRTTMEVGALREFIADTEWGDLDYLLLDLPPGTDRLPNVAELVPNLDGVIVVTIPSEVSQLIVKKSVTMARDILQIPIIGVVENMACYVCQHCGEEEPSFLLRRHLIRRSNRLFLVEFLLIRSLHVVVTLESLMLTNILMHPQVRHSCKWLKRFRRFSSVVQFTKLWTGRIIFRLLFQRSKDFLRVSDTTELGEK